MPEEIVTNENEPSRNFPREMELIMAAFLPNIKHLESRFDNIDMNIRELRVDVKDSANRLTALEKRMDYFEIQVDKRFEQVDKRFDALNEGFVDFKGDVNRRFEQVDKRFEQVDKRFEQVDKRFEQVDKRFEQVDKRFEQVDKRLDQIAASIERLGDKLDARDARQRGFTLRMFSIAITVSFLGVLGVLAKSFGVL